MEDTRQRSTRRLWVPALSYLALSFVIVHALWTNGPSRSVTCACADPSLFVWMFQWPVTALQHGLNPWYSHAMFAGSGINLLANTGLMGWTWPLALVTYLFGPVASLNTASLLAPVFSATAAFWLARRWSGNALGSWVGGLLYGFSPLVLFHLGLGHLNLVSLWIPPLVVAVLADLVVEHRHGRTRMALALAGLVTWQFFLSTEVLVLLVVLIVVTMLVATVIMFFSARSRLRDVVVTTWRSLAIAAAASLFLLAVPTWYALRGPGHYNGPIWPGKSFTSASVRSFLLPVNTDGYWFHPHDAHFIHASYLGIPLVLLAIVMVFIGTNRDRLWALAAGVGGALTLAPHYGFAPWHYLAHLGLFASVSNERFAAFTMLPLALLLASACARLSVRWPNGRGRAAAALLALMVAVPFLPNALRTLPYQREAVWTPTWYQHHAPPRSAHAVILGFPFFTTSANLLSVQALHHMDYAVVGGTTPQWLAFRQGAAASGYRVVMKVASRWLDPTRTSVSVRERHDFMVAMDVWHTTDVVVPMDYGFNTSPAARPPQQVAVLLTLLIGERPQVVDGAWVWHFAHHTHFAAS